MEKLYQNRRIIFVLSAILIFVCYLSFLFAPFYFDDFYNIVHNPYLNSPISSLKCNLGGSRPLAYLWFYMDKTIFGLNPFYFRMENIIGHLLNFILVFNVIKKLTSKYGDKDSFLISFFTALLWGLHPINSQSVAYIVQRMNEVAVFFTLAGFLFYLDFVNNRKIRDLFFVVICLILGLGFKETAILLIPLCLLHYFLFVDKKKAIFGLVLFVIISLSIVLFLPQFQKVLPLDYLIGKQVNDKHFTIFQKFITSFKVIIDYIIVFVFPLFKNIHLYYDFAIEKNLFSAKVLFPLIFILLCLGFAVYQYKKDKLMSFSIFAFFFLLFPENSFLPLDIAYQHRMYLPSVFLSLIVVVLFFKFLKKDRFVLVLSFMLIFLAINLVVRGVVFSIPEKFYKNEINHAPDNVKIYINAAKNLIEAGDLEDAYFYLKRGIKRFPDNALLATNMGLYYAKTGDLSRAIYWYKRAERKDNPFLKEVHWSLAILFLEKHDFNNAKKYINILKKENFAKEKIEFLENKVIEFYSAEATSE
ncbi:conserved hypothetical protein [Thermotomaculum hydrothermale]|uniref:Tetratricopeptide repeat protein n=1 Tax=Thermotomaculum hydrothermale TaxID=981385 RepID=A0A7R6SYA6_9BACT|nr:glycosyltransferase family 39 protein [Thermotomaculum hydrothermale]BBB31680.1 conserved hypothetical protein [Thermotomaculum hydrothermale]